MGGVKTMRVCPCGTSELYMVIERTDAGRVRRAQVACPDCGLRTPRAKTITKAKARWNSWVDQYKAGRPMLTGAAFPLNVEAPPMLTFKEIFGLK